MNKPAVQFVWRLLPIVLLLLFSVLWHVANHPDEAPIAAAWFIALLTFIGIETWRGLDRERRLAAVQEEKEGTAETLRQFLDNLPALAVIKDHEGRYVVANEGFRTLLGIDPASIVGKRPEEVFGDETGRRVAVNDRSVIDTGSSRRALEELGERIFDTIKFPLPRRNGPPDIGGIAIDITERRQAEARLRESELRLRLIGDNLPEAYIFQYGRRPDGRTGFLYLSSGVEHIHGISPESAMADADVLKSKIARDDRTALEEIARQSRQQLSDFEAETQIQRADGKWGWLRLRARPRRLDDGSTVWDGVATDVTGEHQIKEALNLRVRRAGTQLALLESAAELDESTFMRFALDQMEALTGSRIAFMHFISADGKTIESTSWSANTEAVCASSKPHAAIDQAGLWADAVRSGQAVVVNERSLFVQRDKLPDGHSPLSRMISVPVVDNGAARLVIGVGNKPEDYTHTDVETLQLIGNEVYRVVLQRRIEAALQVADQVVNSSPTVCFRWRAEEGRPVVFVSGNIRRWGYDPQRILAGDPPYTAMVHPDDLARVIGEAERFGSDGRNSYSLEYRLRTGDGREIQVLDVSAVIRDDRGRPLFYDGVVTDISERVRQERVLSENLAAQRALNKKLEEAHNQLLQSEKMASIGQLAAGVAHELNNPIGFVHSNLGTLDGYLRSLMEIIEAGDRIGEPPEQIAAQRKALEKLKLELDFAYLREDIFSLLSESRDGLGRVKRIVQDLKSFSRVGEQEWQWADLHQGIDSTLNIVWNELKYKCTVIKDYGELPKVHCLISQLNQVFMNLLVNAGQAIESRGEIVIRTRRCGEDAVSVEISDTGAGIPEDNLKRIFDPFFTTKPVGTGTGLGLSLSYSIVERHRGKIEVHSVVGEGTTFRLTLPINQTGETAGQRTGEPLEAKQ
ncbi:MAG TPA: PAS domain S-box protein [Azospira sp.]|nr:PAS domain S-box protein [Azospira sp.]